MRRVGTRLISWNARNRLSSVFNRHVCARASDTASVESTTNSFCGSGHPKSNNFSLSDPNEAFATSASRFFLVRTVPLSKYRSLETWKFAEFVEIPFSSLESTLPLYVLAHATNTPPIKFETKLAQLVQKEVTTALEVYNSGQSRIEETFRECDTLFKKRLPLYVEGPSRSIQVQQLLMEPLFPDKDPYIEKANAFSALSSPYTTLALKGPPGSGKSGAAISVGLRQPAVFVQFESIGKESLESERVGAWRDTNFQRLMDQISDITYSMRDRTQQKEDLHEWLLLLCRLDLLSRVLFVDAAMHALEQLYPDDKAKVLRVVASLQLDGGGQAISNIASALYPLVLGTAGWPRLSVKLLSERIVFYKLSEIASKREIVFVFDEVQRGAKLIVGKRKYSNDDAGMDIFLSVYALSKGMDGCGMRRVLTGTSLGPSPVLSGYVGSNSRVSSRRPAASLLRATGSSWLFLNPPDIITVLRQYFNGGVLSEDRIQRLSQLLPGRLRPVVTFLATCQVKLNKLGSTDNFDALVREYENEQVDTFFRRLEDLKLTPFGPHNQDDPLGNCLRQLLISAYPLPTNLSQLPQQPGTSVFYRQHWANVPQFLPADWSCLIYRGTGQYNEFELVYQESPDEIPETVTAVANVEPLSVRALSKALFRMGWHPLSQAPSIGKGDGSALEQTFFAALCLLSRGRPLDEFLDRLNLFLQTSTQPLKYSGEKTSLEAFGNAGTSTRPQWTSTAIPLWYSLIHSRRWENDVALLKQSAPIVWVEMQHPSNAMGPDLLGLIETPAGSVLVIVSIGHRNLESDLKKKAAAQRNKNKLENFYNSFQNRINFDDCPDPTPEHSDRLEYKPLLQAEKKRHNLFMTSLQQHNLCGILEMNVLSAPANQLVSSATQVAAINPGLFRIHPFKFPGALEQIERWELVLPPTLLYAMIKSIDLA